MNSFVNQLLRNSTIAASMDMVNKSGESSQENGDIAKTSGEITTIGRNVPLDVRNSGDHSSSETNGEDLEVKFR